MNKKMRDLLAKIKSKTEEARQHNEAGEVDLVKACLDEVDNLKGEYETEKRFLRRSGRPWHPWSTATTAVQISAKRRASSNI